MKKLLITLTAASAIAAASPAVAQYGNQSTVDPVVADDISDRIDQLEDRLESGIDAGTIDRAEARNLRTQIRQLNRLESQYSRNGLTQDERRDLRQRLRAARQQLRLADGGNNSRYADWDREDGYNRGGYNQGYNRGVQYQEVNEVCAQTNIGLGSLLGRILGTDNCLRVGERVTANLSAVPAQYRDQFRDGSGYYYGYLEGSVVQIDSRSRVVTRIYDVT